MNLLTIVGARPQFIKAAMFSRAVRNTPACGIRETLVHTGQHYDENMSRIFFDEMDIPRPAYQLNIHNGTHGEMTGRMMIELETIMQNVKPDSVLVYGDTDSTLAAALDAAKCKIPVLHVEAGLRSFNRNMPEEINRVMTDHVSKMLFAPTFSAVENLKKEGIGRGVFKTGDIMFDAARVFTPCAREQSRIMERLSLHSKSFFLATVHRPANTDSKRNLGHIMTALQHLAKDKTVVFPVHPRTRKMLNEFGFMSLLNELTVTEPLSFFDMLTLEDNASVILTDSGGVQKESYFHHVPCVTLRDETEWVETVSAGWNTLAGADCSSIVAACDAAHSGESIPEFGDGHAAEEILRIIHEEYVQ